MLFNLKLGQYSGTGFGGATIRRIAVTHNTVIS
uniref:Uncharacterized protein n=1 Tax=Anguilla anguilla TaxID=7936 RepID=A0A0E9XFG7_ANGAN